MTDPLEIMTKPKVKRPQVDLVKGVFEESYLEPKDGALWVLSPKWSTMDRGKLLDITGVAFSRSLKFSYMVLWVPVRHYHKISFDPKTDIDGWKPLMTILSGTGANAKIGILFNKITNTQQTAPADYIHVPDYNGGSASSQTVRWLLINLDIPEGSRIIDPWAHKSATLATWCRRHGFRYTGWIRSKKSFKEATKILNQIELPLKQSELKGLET